MSEPGYIILDHVTQHPLWGYGTSSCSTENREEIIPAPPPATIALMQNYAGLLQRVNRHLKKKVRLEDFLLMCLLAEHKIFFLHGGKMLERVSGHL